MTICKQLTSTAMFFTPGLFRALQNDYRIKGKTRQRAVQILSDGYGLPIEDGPRLTERVHPGQDQRSCRHHHLRGVRSGPCPSKPV